MHAAFALADVVDVVSNDETATNENAVATEFRTSCLLFIVAAAFEDNVVAVSSSLAGEEGRQVCVCVCCRCRCLVREGIDQACTTILESDVAVTSVASSSSFCIWDSFMVLFCFVSFLASVIQKTVLLLLLLLLRSFVKV